MKLQKKIDALRPAAGKATEAFHFLFFCYVCLGFNNLTVGTKIISVFMWPTYLLGAAILAWRVLDYKRYIRMPGLLPLCLLCLSAGISLLLNRRYDPKGNLIHLIFWLFYFLILYVSGTDTPPQTLKKCFIFYFHAFCAVAFVLTAISFGMLAAGYGKEFTRGGDLVRQGYLGGRLFGAYQTPNAGAIIGALVTVGSVHFIRTCKNRLYTAAAAINIAAQFVYAVLSDSRSGRVCLGLCLGVYLFFVLCKRENASPGRSVLALALAAAVTAGGFFLPKWSQLAYNAAVISTQRDREQRGDDVQDPTQEDEDEPFVIGRKESLEGDFSNRRLDFWKSGLELFLRKPVFGLTFKGFLPYAKEYLPDTYLVTNDYMQMNTLDNDVINLAVSCGLAGLLPFFAFVFVVLRRLWLFLRRKAEKDPLLPLLLSVCAGAAAASMFTSGVLYMQCQYSFLFWLALGLTMRMAAGPKEEKS